MKKMTTERERERVRENLSRKNPYYLYDRFKKYQGHAGYEASAKKLSNELKI